MLSAASFQIILSFNNCQILFLRKWNLTLTLFWLRMRRYFGENCWRFFLCAFPRKHSTDSLFLFDTRVESLFPSFGSCFADTLLQRFHEVLCLHIVLLWTVGSIGSDWWKWIVLFPQQKSPEQQYCSFEKRTTHIVPKQQQQELQRQLRQIAN